MILLSFIALLQSIINVTLLQLLGVPDDPREVANATLWHNMMVALQDFSNTLWGISEIMPLISTPLQLLIWAIFLNILLLMYDRALWLIGIIRG